MTTSLLALALTVTAVVPAHAAEQDDADFSAQSSQAVNVRNETGGHIEVAGFSSRYQDGAAANDGWTTAPWLGRRTATGQADRFNLTFYVFYDNWGTVEYSLPDGNRGFIYQRKTNSFSPDDSFVSCWVEGVSVYTCHVDENAFLTNHDVTFFRE